MRLAALLLALSLATPAAAGSGRGVFDAIEGGRIDLADWAGQPVLVVNTASLCGFTRQYDEMQALYDRYRDRGLVVLAVPSDEFSQELGSNAEVRDFCAVNFDLDLPMTGITPLRGEGAHPFYAWLAADHGIVPGWNFTKVLLDGAGEPVAVWGPRVAPTSGAITARIEPLLD